ncbi:hypothetical protein scyTo_0022496, partial [Scyliorhinus torazame]|nr:hypothetical protein [Scyliorhinus torazame]
EDDHGDERWWIHGSGHHQRDIRPHPVLLECLAFFSGAFTLLMQCWKISRQSSTFSWRLWCDWVCESAVVGDCGATGSVRVLCVETVVRLGL